jgi:hypothetical protein
MNVAIFISRGNSPQRHREHGGFFWVPKDTLPGGSGVARLFALQYIHPQAITTNRRRISKRDQTRTTAQQTFFSPADLGALCASVVKSSSSATSSHALRRVEAVGDGGTTSEAHPLAYSSLSGIDYPYLAVSFAANSSDARGGELNDSQRIWLQQKR